MPLALLILILVIGVLSFKLYLNARQISAIQKHYKQVPKNFVEQISLEDHQKAANYSLEKLRLSNYEILLDGGVFALLTFVGGINLINDFVYGIFKLSIFNQVLVMALVTVVTSIISLPFSLYSIFNIEQKYGFNKMTPKLFVLDFIKTTLIAAIIGIPLLYLIIWLMEIMGSTWWFWVWMVLVVFNLMALVIYPTLIAPLFNKFTLLDNPQLLERINKLLDKCGFKSNGVFVMDGSKRSSHGNAYFTGIGKSKRIVFFDTLLKNLSDSEIEAVLAHELGHFKKKHILKQIIISFLLTLVLLYVASLVIHNPAIFSALNIDDITSANGLIMLSLLSGFVLFPLGPISKYFTRKNEFEADDFAKTYTDAKDLINGLVKLYRDNASTLTPDDLYVKFYYSHPPAVVRIANLEKHS